MAVSAVAPFLDEKKSLACIHCGLCLGSCPTYLETGNENDSPRGRIYIMRALHDGRMTMADASVRHIDLCLGCRACEAACPSGVQYGALLESTREHIEGGYRRSLFQTVLRRIAIERVFPFPRRMRLALWPARLIKRWNLTRFVPKQFRDALELIPSDYAEIPLPETSPASTAKTTARAGFIRGCVMSILFQETNASSVRLLNEGGADVITPPDQTCCGALYSHNGNLEKARECARRNIEVFERYDLDEIIINAAGCGSTLKEYGHLLHGDPKWAARAEKFSAKVKDLTEWLAVHAPAQAAGDHSANENGARQPERKAITVTYHDACHLAHAQRITQPPRSLLRQLSGVKFVELPESDVCCGSAGSYNLTEPEMAERLQHRKTDNILRTGAEIVVTTNPGCLLQIQAGLRKTGASHIRAMHIADFLREYGGAPRS